MNSVNVEPYQSHGGESLFAGSSSAGAPCLQVALVTETFPPEVNGVAMTWGQLTHHLSRLGHAVQVIRPRQLYEASDVYAAPRDLVLTPGFPLPTYPELRFGVIGAGRLKRQWRHFRPDVVHVATEGPLGWSAVSAARSLGIPVASSFHTNFQQYSSYYGASLLQSTVEAYLRMFHNRTLATLAPTQAMARSLADRGFQNTGVLSRGVATEQFSPLLRSQELRAGWGAKANDLVVLYVGRLAKEKSVGTVLTAFSSIQAAVPTAKLVLVGDGPMRETLRDLCPQAIFCGVKKGRELATHYASGDLFLFPSLTETFGNVVPEALASGLAVVSYRCAAAAELITHEAHGMLVEPGDEEQFIRASVLLAVQSATRDALRQAAPSCVARMSWRAVTEGLVNTWHDVIERHQRALTALPGTGAKARPAPQLNQRNA